MDDFTATATKAGFTMKLWRGERTCLVAFDVAAPEPDLVGFAIECKPPGAKRFLPLMNRLAFSYDKPLAAGKYIIKWKNGSSDDGHPEHGAFAITVK